MCGGFSIYNLVREDVEQTQYKLKEVLPAPNYNARPGQYLPVVIAQGNRHEVVRALWGIQPPWAKSVLINTKAESIETSRWWRQFFPNNRCLVLANGFFEWQKAGEERLPYYFKDKKREMFAMAGIYQDSKDAEGYQTIKFSIITTTANKLVAKIHNRMPVILGPTDESTWLGTKSGTKQLVSLLKPYPATNMASYRVSKKVNNARNNSREIIYPLKASGL